MLILGLSALTLSVHAAWSITGNTSLWYEQEKLTFNLLPSVTYSINQTWAVGSQLGVKLLYANKMTTCYGVVKPYVRYTVWHNDVIYLDLRGQAGVSFDNRLQTVEMGIVPSLRVKVADHWSVKFTFGLLGATYEPHAQPSVEGKSQQWSGGYKLNAGDASVGVTYRF